MKRKFDIFNCPNKKQKIKNTKNICSKDIDLLIKMLKKLKLNHEYKNNFKAMCYYILPTKFKYSKKSLRILKEVCEDYLCRIFQLANIFKKYRNKKTLIVEDLLLAQYFIKT
jgi:histone H3/H4